jgi:uncharacterized protein (DUF433 family)
MYNTLSIDLIVVDPEIRSGRPIIGGISVTVADVAIAKIFHHQDADGIAAWYDLSLAQTHAALAYYYQHKEDIDEDIRQGRQIAAEFKENRVGSRHNLLSL